MVTVGRVAAAGVLVLAMAVLFLGLVVLPESTADAARVSQSAGADEAEHLARAHWDNVFQRILYLHLAVTAVETVDDCEVMTVTAFGPFWAALDDAKVRCDQSVDG